METFDLSNFLIKSAFSIQLYLFNNSNSEILCKNLKEKEKKWLRLDIVDLSLKLILDWAPPAPPLPPATQSYILVIFGHGMMLQFGIYTFLSQKNWKLTNVWHQNFIRTKCYSKLNTFDVCLVWIWFNTLCDFYQLV